MNEKDRPWLYRLIRWFVWLFAPKFKLVGQDKLPQEPCVIVANHSQVYGPIAGEIYMPGKHAVWCAGEMMHSSELPAYAYRDFWSQKPKAVRWFYKLFSRLIAPLGAFVFSNAHTIPVYHDSRLITTYRESIAALQDGYSIVIFPEHYDEHNNIVHDFQDKFVDLARFYYKKTGKELSFVPMYVAPRLKSLLFAPAISFHADAPIRDERRRICDALMDAITALAVAQPLHTVVPYPNIPKRDYPKNLPLEDLVHDSKAL